MKQKYKICVHYQTYDGYMGFDDWDDEYADVEIVSSKLGDELTQEIVDFAKNKYKHKKIVNGFFNSNIIQKNVSSQSIQATGTE